MAVSDEDRLRIQAAQSEARQLGYSLLSEHEVGIGELTHAAIAAPYIPGQATTGRFLTYSISAADAAEAGLEVLRGVVERDDPWPTDS